MKKTLLAAVIVSIIPIGAFAMDTSSGCGVGWDVTQKQTLLATTTRGTTNAFLPNTFSMTSGTSGCAKHPIAKRDVPAVVYVASNYEPLTIQMAEGHGEYLNGLVRTMGCSDSSRAAFGTMTQKNFKALTGQGTDGPVVFDRLKTQIHADPALASDCNA